MPTDAFTPTELEATAQPRSVEGERVRGALMKSLFGHEARTHLGRFEIDKKLGAGGMGVVYAARDPELDRTVAIKLLSSELSSDAHQARLKQEAKAMAKLNHPNVATVYEVGVHKGQLFVAMELIDGTTVRDWARDGPRSWRDVLDVYLQAGDGLVAAHEAGLVHRDFKPDNAMVGADGRVRVLDFGLASSFVGTPTAPSVDLPDSDARLTRTGAVLGTPAYMPPEQLAGERVDARSDQFSFCVSLFEALHGQRPFVGDTLDTLKEALDRGEIAPVRQRRGPGWLRAALRRGLKVDPTKRWPSLRELVTHLRRCQRRRVRRGVLGGVSAVAGVAGLSLWLAAPPPVCKSADEELAGVWGEAIREQMGQRFFASDIPAAAATYRMVAGEFDELASDWRTSWTAACGRDDDPRRQLRELDCLRQHRQEFSFYIGALGLAPVWDAIVGVQLAFAQFPDPTECSRAEIVRATPEPPSRQEADAVREIRGLVLGSAAAPAKNPAEVTGLFEPVVARAEQLEHSVLPTVLVAYARRLRSVGGEPSPLLVRAIEVAERTRNDRAAADARLELAAFTIDTGNVAELGTTLRDAEVAVVRAGRPLSLEVALLGRHADVATGEARYADAQAAHDEIMRRYSSRYGEDDPRVAVALVDKLNAQTMAVDVEGARATVDQGEAWAARTGLETHPGLAFMHRLLASALWLSGDRARGAAENRRADALYLSTRPPNDPDERGPQSIEFMTRMMFEYSTHRCTEGLQAVAAAVESLPETRQGHVHAAAVIAVTTSCGLKALGEHPSLGLAAFEAGIPVSPSWHAHLIGARAVVAAYDGDQATVEARMAELRSHAAGSAGTSRLAVNGWGTLVHFASGNVEDAWRLAQQTRWPAAQTDLPAGAFKRMFTVLYAHLAVVNGDLDAAEKSLDDVLPTLKTCCFDTPIYAFALLAAAELQWARGDDRAEALDKAREAARIAEPYGELAAPIPAMIEEWIATR